MKTQADVSCTWLFFVLGSVFTPLELCRGQSKRTGNPEKELPLNTTQRTGFGVRAVRNA